VRYLGLSEDLADESGHDGNGLEEELVWVKALNIA
jgi:hypothetical protein